MNGLTEADTCRKYVLPKLIGVGWDSEPHSFTEQRTFTDGRIIVSGGKVRRGKQKRADYLLRYTRDFTIAVVEAKANYKSAGDGLQQAKDYAHILGLNFAYATNGKETYGAGRYMDNHRPGLELVSSTEIEVDFNFSYNPYCAYNSSYSCPLPPRENWLKVSIRAGEKRFKL